MKLDKKITENWVGLPKYTK